MALYGMIHMLSTTTASGYFGIYYTMCLICVKYYCEHHVCIRSKLLKIAIRLECKQ